MEFRRYGFLMGNGIARRGQRTQRTRQREDHVDMRGGQKVAAPRLEPAVARVGLALWAMPVTAELKEMVCSPQREHSSTCPPSAEVRQRRMAVSTLRCCQVNHFRLPSKNASPVWRGSQVGARGTFSVIATRDFIERQFS